MKKLKKNNTHCDVHYYSKKFEIKFNFCMENKKGKLHYRVKLTR